MAMVVGMWCSRTSVGSLSQRDLLRTVSLRERAGTVTPRPSGGCGLLYLLIYPALAQADVHVVDLAVVELDADPPEEAGPILGRSPVVLIMGAHRLVRGASSGWLAIERLVNWL